MSDGRNIIVRREPESKSICACLKLFDIKTDAFEITVGEE